MCVFAMYSIDLPYSVSKNKVREYCSMCQILLGSTNNKNILIVLYTYSYTTVTFVHYNIIYM